MKIVLTRINLLSGNCSDLPWNLS